MNDDLNPESPVLPHQSVQTQTFAYPLWDDQQVDICQEEEVRFFHRPIPRPPVARGPLANYMLSSPCEFLLKSVRIDVLARMPEPILDEIANQITVRMALALLEKFDLPLSLAERILTPDEKPQRCWRLDVGEIRIPPLVIVHVSLRHPAIRDDIEPFKARLYLEGDITCPRG